MANDGCPRQGWERWLAAGRAQRRVDLEFVIGYSDDIDKASSTMQQVIDADERILKDKPVQIVVAELADSSVNLRCASG